MTATVRTDKEQKSIQQLWQDYKSGGVEALSEIKIALTAKIMDNPQAAALVASQIIGDSPADSDSEKMAIDIFKRAAACVQHKNPMTLVNLFHGCSERMPQKAERVKAETCAFLGQVSRATPERKFIN